VTDWRIITEDFNNDAETRTLVALQKRWGELKSGKPKRKRKKYGGTQAEIDARTRDRNA
jgi:hypothetical protein